MTTREKLLLQIFERKKKIIDQVNHHALLFDHHLAFKLLIDGITPPPWLSTYESNEVDALSKGLDARDDTSVFQLQSNIAGCASNGLPAVDHRNTIPEDWRDEDPSISSPQDKGCAGLSDTNPEPPLSFVKIQRSKSRQRALQVRNSAKKDMPDENNVRACAGGISVSGTSSLQSEQVVEGNVFHPLDQNNETCAAKDVKVGVCSIEEKGRTICHDEIMCNKILALKCSLNNAHCSSHAIQEEVAVNMDSTKPPAEQPHILNHSNTSSEIYRAAEAKSGDFQSKGKGSSIYSGRITRSRSSTQQGNEFFKLDLSSNNCKKDEITDCMEVVKSVEITSEITDIRAKTSGCQVMKNGSDDYSCRISRSRRSSQPCNNVHASQNLQISPLVQKKIKLSKLYRKKHLNEENSTEGYGSGVKGLEATIGAEKVIRGVTSNNPDQMVTQSMLTASSKSHKENDTSISAERPPHCKEDLLGASSTDSSCKENVADKFPDRAKTTCSEGISKPFNSNTLGCGVTQSRSAPSDMPLQARPINRFEGSMTCAEVKDLPSNSTNEFVNQKRCIAGPAEADSICLGSNLDVADCGIRHEAPSLRTSTHSTMHMEPKQLDFDIVEEPSSNGIPAPVSGKDKRGGVSAKRPITLSEPSNLLNKETYISIQEKGNSPLEVHLLEQQEALSKDGSHTGLSEALAEKINLVMGALDRNSASPVLEMSDIHKDAVCLTLQNSEKTSGGRFALIDNSTNLQVFREDFTKSMPRKEDDTRRNLSESIINLGMSNLDAYSVDQCTCHNTGVDGVVTAEHESTVKSTVRSVSSFVEATWTQNKRRKTEPIDAFYAPASMQEDVPHTTDDNPRRKDLLSEEYCPKTILESFILSDSKEVVAQLVTNRNQVEELDQIEKHNLIEGSESPPKLKDEEAEVTLKGRETIANAPCTSMQEVEASLVSSLTKQAPGDSQVEATMEASLVNRTSFIIDAEKQRTLNVNQVPFCHEADSKLGHAEPWSSTERCMQEKRLDLEANKEFPYCSVSSPYSQSFGMIGTDDTMPVLEGFIMQTDDEQPCSTSKEIKFDELKLPKNTIERVSILERLCKSACLQTPGSYSSAMYKLHRDPDLYQSVPTGLLEGMDMRNKLFNDNTFEQLKDKYDCLNEVSHDSHSLYEYLPCSSSQSGWDLSKPCISPVSKLWDKITSISSSSEKRGTLNPELPCIEEENENIEEVAYTFQEDLVSDAIMNSAKREPLADITENLNCLASEAPSYTDRFSLDSTNTECSLTKTHNRSKKHATAINKRVFNNKEKHTTNQGGYGGKRGTGSLHDRSSKPQKLSSKSSLRKGGSSFSEMETTHNNIVSNVTSFIPLVQQKQAAAVVTGKRDIKVKALEAAEAAKRLAEKKENERKLKKEAMKLERTRLEQENLRQMELQKKRKEEVRKKNEADMAAKKRQRGEEERKEKRKRMRLEESRRQLREQEQKLRAGKEERQATDKGGCEMKKSEDEVKKQEKTAKLDGGDSLKKTSETEPLNSRLSTSDERRSGTINKQFEASSNFGNKTTLLGETDKSNVNDTLIAITSQDQSYEISPYKASDDEDEDEDEDADDLSNKKYVPSWASKNHLALVVSSQTRTDPEVIFPQESFCSITEVLLPRKLQIK